MLKFVIFNYSINTELIELETYVRIGLESIFLQKLFSFIIKP